MCAAVAGPLRWVKVSFHVIFFVVLSYVAVNLPDAPFFVPFGVGLACPTFSVAAKFIFVLCVLPAAAPVRASAAAASNITDANLLLIRTPLASMDSLAAQLSLGGRFESPTTCKDFSLGDRPLTRQAHHG